MELLVYMTVPGAEEGKSIACMLVEKKLAAGVNIVSGVHSVYRWQGEIRNAEECILLAQVPERIFPEFVEAVARAHSHMVPCVIGLPIQVGNPDFSGLDKGKLSGR